MPTRGALVLSGTAKHGTSSNIEYRMMNVEVPVSELHNSTFLFDIGHLQFFKPYNPDEYPPIEMLPPGSGRR
jgi:hypothetical protein